MAITTTTFTKSAGWGRTDVLDQLEEAFTWLGLHGTQISGLVTSISAYNGGGTVGTAGTDYYDVPIATTTGIGTGATFDVFRNSGSINLVQLNRPGYGFTDGEYVTISADNIGGTGNGAVAIGITVSVDGGATPVGYGSTNQFFDKDYNPSSDSDRPWAILKQDFDTNKRFGVTYRGFKTFSDYQMSVYVGSSFLPWNENDTTDKRHNYGNSFRGTQYLDIPYIMSSIANSLNYSGSDSQLAQIGAQYDDMFRYATTNSPTTHDLKLNIYRSSIDTSFAVLSYNQPSISGTMSDSTFTTFIIHNFDSDLWDYDDVFSAGITLVVADVVANGSASATGHLGFRTMLVGNCHNLSEIYYTTRTAEAGYAQIRTQAVGQRAQNYSVTSTQGDYTSTTGYGIGNYDNPAIYSAATIYSRVNQSKDKGVIDNTDTRGNRYPITSYRSVIKGIPINGNLIPCPYYLPDDFVLIDFKLDASGQDIKQGDTVTISGSEVYTVITGSYNKYNETSGMLFCARTV